MSYPMPVARARWCDVGRTVDLVTASLATTVLGAWLVPDEQRRPVVLADVARIWTEHALLVGDVFLLRAGTAATVWFHRYRPIPSPARYEERLALACGEDHERFLLLEQALAAHRPTEAHHHLAILAVPSGPDRAARADAVLAGSQRWMDTLGLPTYAETFSDGHRALHGRHGYLERDSFPLLNGMLVHPMWRPASQPGRRGANVTRWPAARPPRPEQNRAREWVPR
ncbi:hypothetical protein AB0F73_28895 [Micromonospora purpureochromogenes]|uniref:hypothetical protein n=1 Tax=Micromonospora purpureochromogenes TaxID=47872 RepID=UPI0034017122